MRRRRLAFAKAIAASAIACSLCARKVGSSSRAAYSASPRPATLPCPKIAHTPANRGSSPPSISVRCAARKRTSACAIVRRIVVIARPPRFRVTCRARIDQHDEGRDDQLLPVRRRPHRPDPRRQHRRPSRRASCATSSTSTSRGRRARSPQQHGAEVGDAPTRRSPTRRSMRSLIASSTDTHADLIEAAAKAGKAIFCEKPIDLDSARVDACLTVVDDGRRAADDRLQPPLRPELRRAAAGSCAAGAIGKLEIAHHHQPRSRRRRRSPTSSVSGGLFRDMMIHDFDMARWLLGEEPVEVYAAGELPGRPGDRQGRRRRHRGRGAAHRVGRARARSPNSRRAIYGYDQRIEVLGAGRHAARRATSHETTVESPAPTASSATSRCTSSSSATPRPIARERNGGEHGIRDHQQGPGDDPEGHPRASPVEAGGPGQVLRASGWQRGLAAEASRLGFARHRQVPAAAGDARGDERGRRAGASEARRAPRRR